MLFLSEGGERGHCVQACYFCVENFGYIGIKFLFGLRRGWAPCLQEEREGIVSRPVPSLQSIGMFRDRFSVISCQQEAREGTVLA